MLVLNLHAELQVHHLRVVVFDAVGLPCGDTQRYKAYLRLLNFQSRSSCAYTIASYCMTPTRLPPLPTHLALPHGLLVAHLGAETDRMISSQRPQGWNKRGQEGQTRHEKRGEEGECA